MGLPLVFALLLKGYLSVLLYYHEQKDLLQKCNHPVKESAARLKIHSNEVLVYNG